MTKKNIISSVGIILLITASYFGYRFLKNKSAPVSTQNKQTQTTNLPGSNPDMIQVPQGDNIVLQGPQGGATVKNFFNDPDVITNDAGIRIANTPQYTIFYSRDFGYITIALFGETISEIKKSQQVAEEKLLEKLGGNKQEICKIDIAITWPPELIGKNQRNTFPLSFCPDN